MIISLFGLGLTIEQESVPSTQEHVQKTPIVTIGLVPPFMYA